MCEHGIDDADLEAVTAQVKSNAEQPALVLVTEARDNAYMEIAASFVEECGQFYYHSDTATVAVAEYLANQNGETLFGVRANVQ